MTQDEPLSEVVVGRCYTHRVKRTRYFVIAIGKYESTLLEHVVYHSNVNNPEIWIRPLEEFKEKFES